MKKMLTGLLVISLLLGTLMPINGFAQKDGGLEKAIKEVKEKLHIPNEFTEFSYNVHTSKNKKVWHMNWREKKDQGGSVEASIDSNGAILSYNFYEYNKDHEKKLPKYTKEQGEKIAEEFIKKIDSKLYDQLKYEEYQDTRIAKEYRYHYIRMVNNIPFYRNDVRIYVNSQTGEVNSFYRSWDDDLTFPNPKKAIFLEEAQKAFQEELGLELIYKYRYDEKQIKPYLVYTTKYHTNYTIDAFTGKKIKMEYPVFSGRMSDEMAKEVASEDTGIQLSPQEIKAVKEASKLISKEEAEKIARSTQILNLSKSFKLSNASLNRDWPMKKDFTWHLYFSEERKENGKNIYNYVNVGIDAATGKFKNFYISDPYKEDAKAVFDQEASRKAVEKFLKEFVPEQYAQTKYDENNDHDYFVKGEEKPLSYTFTYTRMVEGVPFRENTIIVRYNAVTGKITSFNIEWFNIKFPSARNVVGMDTVYEKMFQAIGLELQYKVSHGDEISRYNEKSQKVQLVYAIKNGKPVIFDGNTCEILNYDGIPYKEEKEIAYTDIKGHPIEKEIQALADSGIGFEEKAFRPDEKITQRDFFRLFVKILNYYGSNGKDEKSVKEMYAFLIRENILKENEKALKDFVTKEDVAKYAIRVLKYDEVAKLKGIYKYPFKDLEKANKEYIGHITLAYGLGLVKGNDEKFEPKKQISRADAAKIIFEYLNK